ncbi:MAG TPA: hypothetical protein DD670_04370 [Planctomycetaceae bacterium]|nr:hypothetical protein [Planctomycetaceae bacterium]
MSNKQTNRSEHEIGRREFLARTAMGGAALAIGSLPTSRGVAGAEGDPATRPEWLRQCQQRTPLAPPPLVSQVRHSRLCYDPGRYCGHPRQGIIQYFGNGEIIVGHNHAPCEYKKAGDARHGLGGYHSRAKLLLQRSLDGGQTWPEDQNVVVYDETISTEAKRAFLYQKDAPRDECDMFHPESVFFFGRTFLPDRGEKEVCFALRSVDKGRTWEKTPTIIEHPDGADVHLHKDCYPVVRMPDGKTLLADVPIKVHGEGVAIFASTDNGLTWQYRSNAVKDISGTGRFTYPGLLLLPNGEVQCYSLHISRKADCHDHWKVDGLKDAICVCRSTDGGHTWSDPAPIVGKGMDCWTPLGDRAEGSNVYRSPWPLLLADGRILVLFGRRRFPYGIGGTVSEDGGTTWSKEFVIRAGQCSVPDLGYPVACQLEDGSIFTAYYYNTPGGTSKTAVRYIAGTSFRLG